jgi:glycerol-3-phosphate dehydrogenase (NAD(P)+)
MRDAAAPASLAVLGAGAWGSVLASLLAANGHDVRLWCRDPAGAAAIARTRRNDTYLPVFDLPDGIRVTPRLDEAVDGVEAAVLAIPTRGIRELLANLPPLPAIVSASKGFLGADLSRASEVIGAGRPGTSVAALSGPNLADEIARGLPAAAVLASADEALGRRLQALFARPSFRVYVSTDVAGVEACGALKNVIALAAGMSDGLGLGDNAHAALITRGLAELVRVGTALGGEPRTFYGLAGVGDLVATCGSSRSRNHQVGVRLARGEPMGTILDSGITAEGVDTVRHVVAYALKHELELPIAREVHRVVYEGLPAAEALRALMARAPKGE